jgi:hypothetical protein
MHKFILIVITAILIASCQTFVDLSLNQIDRQFKLDSLHVERKVKCGVNDSLLISTVDYIFPVFKDTALEWVNAFIINKLKSKSYPDSISTKSLKEIANLYLNDFENFSKDGIVYSGWYLLASCSAAYLNDSILKISFGMEEFSGGAHPNHHSENYLWDIKNRKQLTLIDFLNSPQDTIALRKVALKELREMKNLKPNQTLDDDANMFIDDQSFYLSKNFDIDSANVSFLYNEYEIQAYAFGYIEIIIPKAKLRKQLKSKFLN